MSLPVVEKNGDEYSVRITKDAKIVWRFDIISDGEIRVTVKLIAPQPTEWFTVNETNNEASFPVAKRLN
jgi:hypothetical protein